MAASDDFKAALKAGKLTEAFTLAMSQAIELNITTWVASANDEQTRDGTSQSQPKSGNRLRTRINLIEGAIDNEIGEQLISKASYQELQEFHLQQVREGNKILENNLQSLQKLFSVLAILKQQQLTNSSPQSPLLDLDITPEEAIPQQKAVTLPSAKANENATTIQLKQNQQPSPQFDAGFIAQQDGLTEEDEEEHPILTLTDLDPESQQRMPPLQEEDNSREKNKSYAPQSKPNNNQQEAKQQQLSFDTTLIYFQKYSNSLGKETGNNLSSPNYRTDKEKVKIVFFDEDGEDLPALNSQNQLPSLESQNKTEVPEQQTGESGQEQAPKLLKSETKIDKIEDLDVEDSNPLHSHRSENLFRQTSADHEQDWEELSESSDKEPSQHISDEVVENVSIAKEDWDWEELSESESSEQASDEVEQNMDLSLEEEDEDWQDFSEETNDTELILEQLKSMEMQEDQDWGDWMVDDESLTTNTPQLESLDLEDNVNWEDWEETNTFSAPDNKSSEGKSEQEFDLDLESITDEPFSDTALEYALELDRENPQPKEDRENPFGSSTIEDEQQLDKEQD